MNMSCGTNYTDKKHCGNCAYHDDWTWVCFNPEVDERADFTDESHVCSGWEDKSCEKKFQVG